MPEIVYRKPKKTNKQFSQEKSRKLVMATVKRKIQVKRVKTIKGNMKKVKRKEKGAIEAASLFVNNNLAK